MYRFPTPKRNQSSFPTPNQRPAFSGVMSNTHSVDLIPNNLHNMPVSAALHQQPVGLFSHQLQRCTKSTGMLSSSSGRSLGSGTLLPNLQFLVAKHSLEGKDASGLNVRLGYLDEQNQGHKYLVHAIQEDPRSDLALLTLRGPIDQSYQAATVRREDQPSGRHFITHHAGGFPMQVSTGEFVDGGAGYSLQHELLVDAGPMASGAGVRDQQGNLIGVCVSRTTEYGAIAREVVLLSQSALFGAQGFSAGFQRSEIRPSTYDAGDPLYSEGPEGRIPPEVLVQMTEQEARDAEVWQDWKQVRKNIERKVKAETLTTTQASAQALLDDPNALFLGQAFQQKHIRNPRQGSLNEQVRQTAAKRSNVTQSTIIGDPLDRPTVVREMQQAVANLTSGDIAVDWTHMQGGKPTGNIAHGPRFELREQRTRTVATSSISGQAPQRINGPQTLVASLTLENGQVVIPHVDFKRETRRDVSYQDVLRQQKKPPQK